MRLWPLAALLFATSLVQAQDARQLQDLKQTEDSLKDSFAKLRAEQDAKYPPVDRFDFDAASLAKELSDSAKDLDWSALSPDHERPVTYFGEIHTVDAIRVELTAALPKLKASGVTHLALEMSTDSQADLDTAPKDPAAQERIRAYEEKTVGPQLAEGYLHLIAAAHAVGVRVLAIDEPRNATKDGPGNRLGERDESMAHRLADVLGAEPGARVIVLLGRTHAEVENQPRRLNSLGYRSRSYAFLMSGVSFQNPSDARETPRVTDAGDYRVRLALERAGLINRPLFLESRGLPFTGLLSLPSVITTRLHAFLLHLL